MNPDHKQLLNLSFRLIVAWTLLSVLAMLYARPMISVLLPFISWLIDFSAIEYTPALSVVQQQGSDLIQMRALVVQPVHIGHVYTIVPGAVMTAGTHVIHNLVPFVILYSLVIAMPVLSWRERMTSFLFATVMLLLMLGISIPSLLMGHIEMLYQNLAAQYGVKRNASFWLDWMIFIETGGRWIMSIVGALLTVLITRFFARHVFLNPTGHSDKVPNSISFEAIEKLKDTTTY